MSLNRENGAPRRSAEGAGPARRPLLRRLPIEVRLVVLAAIHLGPPGLLAVFATFVFFTLRIPDPMALRREHAPIVRVLARDGSLLGERGGGEAYVPIDLLPKHLVDAVVATEDRRFFSHWGLDGFGLLRAALADLRAGQLVQGGSTLTQQLAKNLFLGSERTVRRKLEELILALWLELRLGKRDILELYLNRVYFGGGAYGVEAAAQRFFSKSAQHVTLAEAAVLAGLLKAPSKYSPAYNPAIARARARNVLAAMVDARLITPQEADAAGEADIAFAGVAHWGRSCSDYALESVLERLPHLVGSPTRELLVETTIDRAVQCRAQGLLRTALERQGQEEGAGQAGLLLIDTQGGIRAVVGGRDYAESQFNRAFKARRQPGSAFKLFVYLAALENGFAPDSKVLDVPILGLGWSPRNAGAGYRGAVTVREAFAQSLNTAAVRVHMSVGPRNTASAARRLGIRSALREDASLALGTSEVTLLELTAAYGVVARGGRTIEPYLIEHVHTPSGQVLYTRPEDKAEVVIAPAQVRALDDMLRAVVEVGTGRRAALPQQQAAGKTGTSQGFRDAWFIGYTGDLVAGVWVGNDDGRAMKGVVGGGLPALLWREVMLAATAQRPAAPPAPVSGGPPQLPRERIGSDFVERALAASAEARGFAADRQ
jgi:penicillin-binding protein 1A